MAEGMRLLAGRSLVLLSVTTSCAVEVGDEDLGLDAGLENIEVEAQCSDNCPPFPTGIYVLTFGESLAAADLRRAASSPNVTGVVVRIPWALVQPMPARVGEQASYDWSELDEQLDLVPTGKKVGLAITAGTRSPSWFCGSVYPGQCRTFSYNPGGPLGGDTITVPRPFSSQFQTLYGNMITALGAHLQGTARYDRIAYVKLDGVNMTTDEVMLPLRDAAGVPIDWSVASPTDAAIAAFKFFAEKWARAFGSKRLSYGAGADLSLATPLRDWMKTRFATRGIVQQNGLKDGANLAGTVTGAMTGSPHTLGGWQPWASIKLEGCVMYGSKACEPTSCSPSNLHKVFRGLVKFGLGLCSGQTNEPASFFEMYKQDVLAFDVVQADNINYVKSAQALIKANGPSN